ncbi:calcium channel protein CCH1 [Nakaseomyces bracarensis]|uniref:calcium channel protein CCH1 n=1 Tax=Nakaseomyces bracarensis TaxID=273131 RepID=UPI0038713217
MSKRQLTEPYEPGSSGSLSREGSTNKSNKDKEEVNRPFVRPFFNIVPPESDEDSVSEGSAKNMEQIRRGPYADSDESEFEGSRYQEIHYSPQRLVVRSSDEEDNRRFSDSEDDRDDSDIDTRLDRSVDHEMLSVSSHAGSPSKKWEPKIANLFKPSLGKSDGKKRPKLSLRTTSFAGSSHDKRNSGDEAVSPSAKSVVSNLSTGIKSNILRRRSMSASESGRTRSASTDKPLRSAKVLSYIDADDMDDFEDMKREFQSAIDDKKFAWLPQLQNKDEEEDEGPVLSPTEIHSNNAGLSVGASPNLSASNRSVDNSGDQELFVGQSSFFQHSKHSSRRPSITATVIGGLGLIPSKDEEIEEETFNVELPNFEEYDKKKKKRKQPLILHGKSIGYFGPNNPLRIKVAHILLTKQYKALYTILLTFYTALVAYRTYDPSNYDFLYRFKNWSDYITFIISIIFTVNDISKIFAFGFWDDSELFAAHQLEYISLLERFGITKFYRLIKDKYGPQFVQFIIPFKIVSDEDEKKMQNHMMKTPVTMKNGNTKGAVKFNCPRAFCRSSWNRIDLVSSCCFWLGMFLSISDYDKKVGIRIFKPLAVMRIFRLVNTDTGITSILRGLKYGMPQLVNVGSMLVYFWVFFGILGVQIFKGSFRRQCVWINPEDSTDRYQFDMQFCGGFLEPGTKKHMKYIFNSGKEGPVSKGFLCPQNSKCISNANPYNGRISFDNIVNSMELVFIIMSANTFTDLMYYTMDSDEISACLFFIVSIFVLTIWMMNLLIAALVSSFQLAHEEFKKKKMAESSNESWPVRFALGYWRYFKVKASQTTLPNWAEKGLFIYEKVEPAFIIVIFFDLIMRSLIKASSPEHFVKTLLRIDRGVTIVLFIESFIRLVLHIPNMWKFLTRFDYVYDLFVAILTLIITILANAGLLGHTYYWLSFFQITRFYRIVISIGFTRRLWKKVLGNGLMIWNLSAFYFLFTFLAAIIMALYFEGVIPKDQMDDEQLGMFSLPNSFLSLFTIGSTENWTDILYALQKYSPNISSAFFSSVFLIIWFILSNSVILNIFIALISESLQVKEEEKRPLQIKHYLKHIYPEKIQRYRHASLLARLKRRILSSDDQEDSRDFKQFLMRGTAIMNIAQNMGDLSKEFNGEQDNDVMNLFVKATERFPLLRRLGIYTDNPFFKKSEVMFTEVSDINGRNFMLQLNEFEEEKLDYLRENPLFNYSYYLFSPRHRFRRFCQKLVPPSIGKRTDGVKFFEDDTDSYSRTKYFNHIWRDLFVMFYAIATILLIVFSCYVTPIFRMKRNMTIWNWATYLDWAFLAIFSIEFLIKTIADGFVYTPNSYARSPWNLIDFFVLISMWINLIAFLKNDGNLSRVFKGLTALRALRCLTISDTARQTFKVVLFDGMSKIFEAGLVSLTLLFPFTVWGLNLFRGRLGVCNDNSLGKNECFNEFSNEVFKWNVLMPRAYQQPELYLDSFTSAFNSLFQIISLEGWVDLLQNLMNSTGVGTPPSTMASSGNAVFIVAFNFLSMVFILNLFVSFIVNNQAKSTGSAYYTTEEKSWLESQKLLSQAKPEAKPAFSEISRLRIFFYSIAVEKNNFYYATFLQMVTYIHIIMLLSLSYKDHGNGLEYSQVYFMFSTTIFLLQEIFHVYGAGFWIYKMNHWNIIRLQILIVSFFLTMVSFHTKRSHIWYHNVDGFFHLVVFLFIIPQNDTLSELIETAMASLPPILSLTYTWAILFLVYAIALNQIFGLTRLGPNTTDNINFRTVVKALIVLFRCSFGEGWNYIMDDLKVKEPFCTQQANGNYTDCGSKTYAYILLISWNILSMYIFVNMFISLIIGNFSYVYRKGGTNSEINRSEIRKFIEAWARFDPDGTGRLDFSYLPKLMHSFDGPFSFKVWEGNLTIKSLVKNYMEVNPNDPYDVKVDLDGLNKELNTINLKKIIERRNQYRRFVQEVYYTQAYKGAMKFSTLLELVPLYTTYDPRECLGIDQYVRHLYTIGKVDKYLDNERNVDVLHMVVTRWKYHLRKKNGFITPPIDPFDDMIEARDSIGSLDDFPENEQLPTRIWSESVEPISTPRMDYGINNFMWSPRSTLNSGTFSRKVSTSENRNSGRNSSLNDALEHPAQEQLADTYPSHEQLKDTYPTHEQLKDTHPTQDHLEDPFRDN